MPHREWRQCLYTDALDTARKRSRTHLQRSTILDQILGNDLSNLLINFVHFTRWPYMQFLVTVHHGINMRRVYETVTECARHVRIDECCSSMVHCNAFTANTPMIYLALITAAGVTSTDVPNEQKPRLSGRLT